MAETVSTFVVIDHLIKNKDKMTAMISPVTYPMSDSLTNPFLDEVNRSASRNF
jgi:hypothetical protein